MAVTTGTQIASYRVLEKLGEGGMGVVYKALDTALDRTVAIKVLGSSLSGNPDLVERFRTEAKAQANLNHTNLATLYAFLMQDGEAYMVMEFVDGETVEHMIRRRGPIPAAEAVPLFKQALLGIGHAHQAGIIHRDIKPANLMVNRSGIVKVMDFGIAKVSGARGLTKTGTRLGTGWYMSPEQVLNKPIDTRSDIYSLGVTLYQMLTAHLPFETGSEFEIMSAQVSTMPPPPTRFYSRISRSVEYAVLKALEKVPANRFQTVEEFAAAFDQEVAPVMASSPDRAHPRQAPRRPDLQAADPTVTMLATPGSQPSPAKPQASSQLFATRQRKLIAGAGALALVAAAAWITLRARKPQPETVLPPAPTHAAGTPTPLEQQLSAADPAVQMSAVSEAGPKVAFFRAESSAIDPGGAAHLSWSVSGASEVLITPAPGIVKDQGAVDLPIQNTTTFTLIAKSDKGESVSSSTTVRVGALAQAKPPVETATPDRPPETARQVPADNPVAVPLPPRVQTPPTPERTSPAILFEAIPPSIPPGGASVLRWNLTNAQSARIDPVPGNIRGSSGQIRVLPAQSTTYTLTAISAGGGTSTSSVTIEVAAPIRPGVAINVVHDHGPALAQQNSSWQGCWGQLQVVGNHLQFRVSRTTDGRRDDFDVDLNQVQEITQNALNIRNQQAFHVTIGGQHFNFIPQGMSAGQAAATLRAALRGR